MPHDMVWPVINHHIATTSKMLEAPGQHVEARIAGLGSAAFAALG